MILIAIGGNLMAADGRTPYQICNDAVDALARLPGLVLVSRSRWYRSAPVPPSAQPDYVNGVVRLAAAPGEPEPDPALLLSMSQRIEASCGRVRSVPNAARTLDLDIIAMGEGGLLRRDHPDPILPHPRMHGRPFVLLPLREVAADWVHPVLDLSVDRLVALSASDAAASGGITAIATDAGPGSAAGQGQGSALDPLGPSREACWRTTAPNPDS